MRTPSPEPNISSSTHARARHEIIWPGASDLPASKRETKGVGRAAPSRTPRWRRRRRREVATCSSQPSPRPRSRLKIPKAEAERSAPTAFSPTEFLRRLRAAKTLKSFIRQYCRGQGRFTQSIERIQSRRGVNSGSRQLWRLRICRVFSDSGSKENTCRRRCH